MKSMPVKTSCHAGEKWRSEEHQRRTLNAKQKEGWPEVHLMSIYFQQTLNWSCLNSMHGCVFDVTPSCSIQSIPTSNNCEIESKKARVGRENGT